MCSPHPEPRLRPRLPSILTGNQYFRHGGGGLDHTPRGLQSSEATGTAAVDAEAVVWGGVLSVWGLSVSKTPPVKPEPGPGHRRTGQPCAAAGSILGAHGAP